MKKNEINNPKTIIVKKERFFKITVSLRTILSFLFVVIILVFFWYILEKRWLIIELNEQENQRVSLLFSILSSMTLLLFMLACGFEISYNRAWIKFLLIVLIIVIVYYGYENVGITFIFKKNYGLLIHNEYCSNNENGILFFVDNWLFWSFIYVVSLMFMSRD